MAWLPDGEKISKISLVVLAQLTNVTDGRTDRQTDGHRVTAIAALCIASHGKNYSTHSMSWPKVDFKFLWAPAQRKRATMLYFANVLFIYLFFLWPPYSPALVNGGSRKFYTW